MIDKIQLGDTLCGENLNENGPSGHMVKGIVVNLTSETQAFIFLNNKKGELSYVLNGKSKRINRCRMLLIERNKK